MEIKDIKNNTVCHIDQETGKVILKYKGLCTVLILPIGYTYEIKRNSTTTAIFRKSKEEYLINSQLNNPLS